MPDNAITPTLQPPGAVEAAEMGEGRPTLTRPADGATNGAAAAVVGKPTVGPGEDVAALATAGAITGTWTTGATVTSLWAINQIRNAWMGVANVGWKKLYNGGDGAFTALTTLASQARQTGRPISYGEEADGMVHEIYLW